MSYLKSATILGLSLFSVSALADLRVREHVRECNRNPDCIERVLTHALDTLDDMVERAVESRIRSLEERVNLLERGGGGGGGRDFIISDTKTQDSTNTTN